jgi:hypothetical protein
MSHFLSRWLAPVLLCAGLSSNMYAVDGVVLIDQNRALAGNVTPGDSAGFPVTISVAGSYRLAGNLTVPNANTTALSITADNVTIDLNGFSIVGPTVCSGNPLFCSPTGTGVGVDARSQFSITVINGSVRGMGNTGIYAGYGAHIEKVSVMSNGQDGIAVSGGSVSGSTALYNGRTGITANLSVISGNSATFNGGDGIVAFVGTVSGNIAGENARFGFNLGFCPSVMLGNTAFNNTGGNVNFTIGEGCVFTGNAP